MLNRFYISLFTLVALLISVLVNYFFPFAGLWMLFLLPLFGIIIIFPTWLVGNLTILILVSVRFLTHYAAFSGNIPSDFLMRLISTSIVGWIILLAVTFFVIKNNSLIHHLEYLSLTDNLTHTFNRRYLELYSEKLFQDALSANQSLCFLIIDIDHFKAVNDKYGHNVGDKVLQKLTNVIHKEIRKSDVLVRMGGEEFALILPETPLEEGIQWAEKIRKSIRHIKLDHQGSPIPITISIGIAEYQEETLEQLMEKADHALYQAKANGRNRVVTYGRHL